MEEQQRNLLLAVVLSVAVLIGWQIFVEGPKQQAAREQAEAQRVLREAQEAANPSTTSGMQPAANGSVASSGNQTPTTTASPTAPKGEVLKFTTSAMTGAFNTKGARLDDVTLTKYFETQEEGSDNIHLLKPSNTAKPYFADYGWNIFGDVKKQATTPDTVWNVESQSDTVTVMTTELDGMSYRVTYEYGTKDYLVNVKQEVTNTSADTVDIRPYGRIIRYGEQDGSSFFILHEGMIGYFSEDNLEELTYKNVRKDDDKTIKYTSDGGWAGFTDKYWLAALLPDQSSKIDVTYNYSDASKPFFQSYYQADQTVLAPGQSRSYTSNLFVGAKEVNLLDKYGDELGLENFDKAVDFGWFYFLTKPFFKALSFIYGIVGNFGIAILVLTLFIKLLLFPLANASYRSMSKMKLLAPKIAELKEQYGDDRQKLQQATMKFYKEEGVNPLGGCLPILVQIPIFFSLYKVLFVTIEMRHAPFFGWINDLSAKDPTSIFNLFGLLPFDPNAGLFLMISFLSIGIWPILMGITMFAQQKLNPAPADPIQAKVMMFLPIIFTFILAPFPAGLVIYWTWNNLLSVAQQWFIMRNTKLDKVKVRTKSTPPKKS
ncbi:MAG: membrane protein insertase YidC [Alphaproteobacteria bacterium]